MGRMMWWARARKHGAHRRLGARPYE
jgi:hypothetical protein